MCLKKKKTADSKPQKLKQNEFSQNKKFSQPLRKHKTHTVERKLITHHMLSESKNTFKPLKFENSIHSENHGQHDLKTVELFPTLFKTFFKTHSADGATA